MSRLTTYVSVLLIAAVLACGSVLAAFRDAVPVIGAKALLPAAALAALLCAAAWLNAEVLTPRLLRRGKTAAYAAALFGTVYLAILTTTALEYLFREHLALPHRISDYRSPWILLDALSASALVLFSDSGRIITRMKIKDVEDLLPSGQFLRVNRSNIVRGSAVTSFDTNDIYLGDTPLAIGPTYRRQLLDILL